MAPRKPAKQSIAMARPLRGTGRNRLTRAQSGMMTRTRENRTRGRTKLEKRIIAAVDACNGRDMANRPQGKTRQSSQTKASTTLHCFDYFDYLAVSSEQRSGEQAATKNQQPAASSKQCDAQKMVCGAQFSIQRQLADNQLPAGRGWAHVGRSSAICDGLQLVNQIPFRLTKRVSEGGDPCA